MGACASRTPPRQVSAAPPPPTPPTNSLGPLKQAKLVPLSATSFHHIRFDDPAGCVRVYEVGSSGRASQLTTPLFQY